MNIKQFSRGPASKLRVWPTGLLPQSSQPLWSAPCFPPAHPSSLTCAPCFTPSLKGYPHTPSLRTPQASTPSASTEKVMSPSSVTGPSFPAINACPLILFFSYWHCLHMQSLVHYPASAVSTARHDTTHDTQEVGLQ